MKYVRIIKAVVALGVVSATATAAVALLRRDETSAPKHVLCCGDSITQGGTRCCAYPTHLQELLGKDYVVLNAGEGGTATERIHQRLTDALMRVPWHYVIVCAGANDFDGSAEEYRTRMLALLCETYRHGATPVVITFPSRPAGPHAATAARYNPVIRTLPCVVVDWERCADLDTHLADNIHPSREGAVAIAQAVAEAIRALERER